MKLIPSGIRRSCTLHRTTLSVCRYQSTSSFGLSRSWNATENWCSLCKEPFNSWNEHRGKRDHICLEMVYDAVIKYPHRVWDPLGVWEQVASFVSVPSSSVVDGPHARAASSHGGTHAGKEGERESTARRHKRFLGVYDRQEHVRRQNLLLALKVLVDARVLIFDQDRLRQSPLSNNSIGLHGSLVMFKRLFPPLISMFPSAEAKDISGMTQMVSASYNLETVFELCDLRSLLTKKEYQARCAKPSTEDGGGVAIYDSEEARSAAAAGELSYFTKGVLVRQIFGQLRWMTEEGSVECPFGEGTVLPHLQIIGEYACEALIAEIITCKICEYVCRVEQVWRDQGAPRSVQDVPLEPRLTNQGMLGYMHGRFSHSDFGSGMKYDPSRLVGIQQPKVFFYDLGKKKL